MKNVALWLAALWLSTPCLATGCMATAPYRTARTLAHGEHEVAASLSGALIAGQGTTWETGTPVKSTLPDQQRQEANLAPEIAWHYGLLPNLETGLRVGGAGLLTEIDARYRFVERKGLHVAAGVALGELWHTDVQGGRAVVPVVATYELTPAVGLTVAAHAGWRWVERAGLDPHAVPSSIDKHRYVLGRDGLEVGAGLGADWLSPEGPLGQILVTATRWTGEIGVGTLSEYDVWAYQVVLTGGLRFGKEKAEMERAEKEMERRLREGEPFKAFEQPK